MAEIPEIPEIPKTMVIGIYLHGELPLNSNGNIKIDVIPNNMKVNIINGVAPGVPNISTLEDYENMARNVYNKIKRIKNWDKLTKSKTDNITKNIQILLKNTNKTQATKIIKEHQCSYSKNQMNNPLNNPLNNPFKQFAHHYDNSFRITSYESGDKIPDKLYIKFRKGEVINPNNIEEKYFNRIVLYNLEGEPDIFEMFQSVGLNIDEITLGQLLEFLVNLGTENVIIVDLSCYIFKGEPKYLSERNIRYLRRLII